MRVAREGEPPPYARASRSRLPRARDVVLASAVVVARSLAARARPGLSLTLAGLAAAKVAGLCAFASGFLLTRVELRDASACDDFPHAAADDADAASPAPGFPGCWSRAPVNKAVVLVIDGARFDFAGPARAVGNPPAAGSGTRGAEDGPSISASPPPPPPMSVFGDLLARDGPSFGDLFRFVADPPTTTQQRLKGLLTGGLPTFADVGDSFGGGAALREDNVVHIAAARMGLRIAFSGDDTWLDLFPDPRASFRAGCEPFPSFDVKDLDLVDEGVRRHLNATLAEPERWDVLIGHFLGVDHAGHAHGVRSEAMRRKLAENDADVRRVVASMERSDAYDDAMLLVFGDHGMTLAGDHGGGTPEETDAFLFAYHPRAAARRRRKRRARDARGGGGGGGDGGAPRRAELEGAPFPRGPPTYEATRVFPQINFAPTVSAVLGLPAPFGNLGRIDRRAWDVAWAGWRDDAEERRGEDGGEEAAKTVAEKTTVDAAEGSYAAATRAVAAQVRRYLRRYAAAAGTTLLTEAEEEAIFDGGADEGVPPGGTGVRSKRGEPIEGSFEGEEPFGGSSDGSSGTSSSPRDRLRAHEAFLDAAANAARARWTRFDLPRMVAGLALVLAGLLAQLLAVRAIDDDDDDDDDDDSKKPSASDERTGRASAASLEALVHATLTLGLFACRLSNSYVVAEGDAAHFVVASLAFARGAFAIAGASARARCSARSSRWRPTPRCRRSAPRGGRRRRRRRRPGGFPPGPRARVLHPRRRRRSRSRARVESPSRRSPGWRARLCEGTRAAAARRRVRAGRASASRSRSRASGVARFSPRGRRPTPRSNGFVSFSGRHFRRRSKGSAARGRPRVRGRLRRATPDSGRRFGGLGSTRSRFRA